MLAALALAVAAPGVAGCYVAAAGPDVASTLELLAGGRFRYALAAGSLDERAAGRWTAAGPRLTLRTEPTPRPAVFVQRAAVPSADGEWSLHVVWPDGRGIAAVDLRVGLDDGRVLEGYTQDYGWSLPAEEKHRPRWVEFAVPMHALASPRFPLDGAAAAVTFQLTPNDLCVLDFATIPVDAAPGALIVHRDGGDLTYRRRPRC